MRHLRLAFRTLFKSPFLTTVAIVSLALGIGANAAIFSMFNEMLLRALPVQAPDRLVNLTAPGPKPGSQSCNQAGDCDQVFSYPMFRDLERLQREASEPVFTGIAAHVAFGANLSFRGQTQTGSGMLVSGSYFPVLGARPALGRLLGPADDRTPGESAVVVLGHAYWQRRFGGNPSVVGDTLTVNGRTMTIVGVAPSGFNGTTFGTRPEIYVPITMRGHMSPGWEGFEDRRSYWAYLFARLAPGVDLDRARAGVNVGYRSLVQEVEAPLQEGMSEARMAEFRAKTVGVEPGRRGQSSLHGQVRAPLLLLLGVTGFVLLIACANIANLLLARAATRSGEMAVRLSVGASRWRLMAQLLVESCVLAALGGLASLAVAKGTLVLIASLLPEGPAGTVQTALDGSMLLFTAAVTLGTGLLFGLFPAIHSTRPDLLSALKGTSGQPSGGRGAARFRTTLATAQIALSMMLLVAAGLFTKSLLNVTRVDLGVRIDHLATFGISPVLNGYTPERARVLFERLEEALAALPGVTGVTAARVPAIAGSNWGTGVRVQGFDYGPDTDRHSFYNVVGPDYFATMGMPLVAGRGFTRADTLGAAKVAVVNEAFARKFNLERPVGARMAHSGEEDELDTEIVGLVRDTKYSEVKQEPPPLFFYPYRQDEGIGSLTFYVRTSQDPAGVVGTLPGVVAALDADLPVDDLRTMTDQVRDTVYLDRLISVLSAAFAVLATLLAAIGLYGVLAYTVAQRTREIGLRMALGAAPARVRAMVLRQVGLMALVGGAVGLVAAFWLGSTAESLLFGLQGRDPVVLIAAAATLSAVALAAGFVPAHRASSVDPMRALRYE